MAEKQATSKRGVWFKFGRFITGLTLACFFLPFFGVSCEGMDVITVSGADMVAGCEPGGLLAEAGNQSNRGGGDDDADVKLPKVPIEPLAIVALVAAVGAFGMAFLKTRQGLTGIVIASVICIGSLIGLWIKVGGDMKDSIAGELAKKNGGGEMGKQMMKETKVDSGARFGLYLVMAGMIVSAGLCVRAIKEPETAPAFPPPPAPPPA